MIKDHKQKEKFIPRYSNISLYKKERFGFDYIIEEHKANE